MKLGLVVAKTFVKRPFHALKQMESIMRAHSKQAYDLLLFPQAYLQGIYAISSDSRLASKIAIKSDSKLINKIRHFCAEYCLGVGFGFYEKDDNNAIYDSYMIINREGTIRSTQRQLSSHWGETLVKQLADEQQAERVNLDKLAINDLLFEEAEKQELLAELTQDDNLSDEQNQQVNFSQGEALQCSYFGGKRLLVLIGRDLLKESLIEAAISLEPDIVVCPDALALNEGEYQEYKQRIWPNLADRLNCPLFIINGNYIEDDFIKGGALAYGVKRQILELPLDEIGVLDVLL